MKPWAWTWTSPWLPSLPKHRPVDRSWLLFWIFFEVSSWWSCISRFYRCSSLGYTVHQSDLNSTDTAALFYHRLIEAFKFAYAKRSELGDPSQINITDVCHLFSRVAYSLTSVFSSFVISLRKTMLIVSEPESSTFCHSLASLITRSFPQWWSNLWLRTLWRHLARSTENRHCTSLGSWTWWWCRRADLHSESLVSIDRFLHSSTNLLSWFSFGSKVLGPETDIFYNNEMDDFSTPNTTNYFGVPASPANFIAPGRRPVSSMSPLILVENSNQRIQQVLGASGGTRITTSVAQVALLNLWFNENIKQAIDAPRLHSQLLPQEVMAERGFDHVSPRDSLTDMRMLLLFRIFLNDWENVDIMWRARLLVAQSSKESSGAMKRINCGLIVISEKVVHLMVYLRKPIKMNTSVLSLFVSLSLCST